MTNREPTATTNQDKTSETEPLPWKRARDLLDAGALAEAASFLGTVRPDGRPHSARIGAAWYDGNVYFQTGQQTRKARNLEVNPACTLSTSLTGIDLVFEGLAERITDGPTLEAVAAVWREGAAAGDTIRLRAGSSGSGGRRVQVKVVNSGKGEVDIDGATCDLTLKISGPVPTSFGGT